MTIRPLYIVLTGLAIAAGPATAGYFVYKGLTESRKADRYVTVKGLVERIEKADYGVASISYKVAGDDLVALNAELARQGKQVERFLIDAGFAEGEVTLSAPRVVDTQAREYGGNETAFRYILVMKTSVSTQNVDSLLKLSGQMGDLVSLGINLSAFGVQYQLKKFNDLRPTMIAEATQNAKELAQQFADNSGSQIGGIRRAHQGVMQIRAADASPNEKWNEGESSVMKKVRVVSTLEFYLKE